MPYLMLKSRLEQNKGVHKQWCNVWSVDCRSLKRVHSELTGSYGVIWRSTHGLVSSFKLLTWLKSQACSKKGLHTWINSGNHYSIVARAPKGEAHGLATQWSPAARSKFLPADDIWGHTQNEVIAAISNPGVIHREAQTFEPGLLLLLAICIESFIPFPWEVHVSAVTMVMTRCHRMMLSIPALAGYP